MHNLKKKIPGKKTVPFEVKKKDSCQLPKGGSSSTRLSTL